MSKSKLKIDISPRDSGGRPHMKYKSEELAGVQKTEAKEGQNRDLE
jgi:hypothetical protein